MYLKTFVVLSAFITSLAGGVCALQASLPHGFGGVNHHTLQYLDPVERDKAITTLVEAGVSVIRLFS